MANEVIGIEVAVKLDQLRTQLATLGPGMEKEAAAMTAALNKQLKAQTAAVKQQTAAMTAAQKSGFKQIGDDAAAAGTKFDKLGKAMGPLGGVLSRISPEAGAAAASIAGLTGGMEGLTGAGIALGPLFAILAPIALGLGVMAAVMQDTEARAEAAAKAMEGLTAAMKAVDSMTTGAADALTDFKVQTGQLSATEAAYQKAIKQVATEYTLANAAIEESIKLRIEAGQASGLLDDVTALREEQAALKAGTQERARALAGEMEWAAEAQKSAEFTAERDKRAAEGAKAVAAEIRKITEAEREAQAAATALGAEQDAAYAQTLAHLRAEKAEKQQAIHDRIADLQYLADKQKEIEERGAKDSEQLARDSIATQASMYDSIASMAQSSSDGLMLLAEEQSKSNKKAARQTFEVARAVSLAAAIVATAGAVMNALATVPYPAAPFVAAAAGVAGAVQIATIATEKPSFHRGGIVSEGEGQGEVSARLLPNEAVLNRQATDALGRGGVNALNTGGGMGGVSLRIGRLEAREIVRTDIAGGGLIVQAAKSAAARGGNAAGRTGRRPIA